MAEKLNVASQEPDYLVVNAPKPRKKRNKVQDTTGDKILEVVTTIILILLLIVVGYPVIYVVSSSISSGSAIMSGRVLLWPVEPSIAAYKVVFTDMPEIWSGYRNTVFYTFFGVLIQMFMQITCAYPISKRNFQGRSVYTKIIVVTMLVSAGMIPVYLIKTQLLGMIDNIWAILFSGLIGASNVFILRTAFKSSIPGELFDAAAIDGANDYQCLVKIAIPLAKATISVITLYSIVGHWNNYFTAMIYLPKRSDLWPLQLHLRNLLISTSNIGAASGEAGSGTTASSGGSMSEASQQLRYALIVISTVPVLVAYGVVQKYFKGGVMVGSVKG